MSVKGIIIEGPDGAGKTSVANELGKWFRKERGLSSIVYSVPGSTVVGREIRGLLLGEHGPELSPLCERLLFLADHAQFIERVWDVLVEKNKNEPDDLIVICDRWTPCSNLAYASAKRLDGGYDVDIDLLDRVAVDLFDKVGFSNRKRQLFDLAFVLDVRPEVAENRLMGDGRTSEQNYLDLKSSGFKHNVRDFYLNNTRLNKYAEQGPFFVNANQGLTETVRQVTLVIESLISLGEF